MATEKDYSYDLETDVGMVRLYIQDNDPDSHIFTDPEIDKILERKGNDILLASATLLRIIASNESKLATAIRIGNWSKDNKNVPKALIDQAKEWEDQVKTAPASAFASQDLDNFQYRSRLEREALTEEEED